VEILKVSPPAKQFSIDTPILSEEGKPYIFAAVGSSRLLLEDDVITYCWSQPKPGYDNTRYYAIHITSLAVLR